MAMSDVQEMAVPRGGLSIAAVNRVMIQSGLPLEEEVPASTAKR